MWGRDWKGERIFLSLSLWCRKLEIFFPLVALRKHEWKRALDRGNKYTATLPAPLPPSLPPPPSQVHSLVPYFIQFSSSLLSHPILFYLSVIYSCRIFSPHTFSFSDYSMYGKECLHTAYFVKLYIVWNLYSYSYYLKQCTIFKLCVSVQITLNGFILQWCLAHCIYPFCFFY